MTREKTTKFKFKAGCLIIPALFILIISVSVYVFRDGIAVYIGNSMVEEDSFEKADAVLVLGGTIADRLLEAADLYKENKTDLILISKTKDPAGYSHLVERRLDSAYPLDHEIKVRILAELGIPDEDVVVLDAKMPNTYYEALQIYYLMKRKNMDSIAVVTSKLHTKRTSTIFNDIAKGEFEVYVVPTSYDSFNPDKANSVRKHSKFILSELEKLVFYKLTRLFSTDYPEFQ